MALEPRDTSPRAIFRMACRLCWRDGTLSDDERRMLGRVAATLGLSDAQATEAIDDSRGGSSAGAAYGEAEREEVFKKALHLARSDGVFSASERQLLHSLGVALGLRAAELEAQLPAADTRRPRSGGGGNATVMLAVTALLWIGSLVGVRAAMAVTVQDQAAKRAREARAPDQDLEVYLAFWLLTPLATYGCWREFGGG